MNNITDKIMQFFETTGLNILISIVILFLGLLVIKLVLRVSKNSLKRTSVEGATASFIVSIINLVLKLVLILVIVSILFPTASTGLIAALGTAGLAIVFALQGSLANFANGIIIIFTKPFKEGDSVKLDSVEGNIRSIGILTTELVTFDNKKVVLSNTKVIGSTIINYSARPTRRIDLTFSVEYGSDTKKVREILEDIANNHEYILDTPKPLIRMSELGESSLNFIFRVWTPTNQFRNVTYDVLEQAYNSFVENNIKIPYNKMDIYITNKEEEEIK